MTDVKHCAKFTDAILTAAHDMLTTSGLYTYGDFRILDPFAGTGKGVEYLRVRGYDAWGVELEPEWAALSEHVIVGNALALPFKDESFDAIFTSPTYGNRMADKDMRPSVAGTYAKSLGRHASAESSAHLQWGLKYRLFHECAWTEALRTLKPGGYFLLNIKDHYRAKARQRVTMWHLQTLLDLGLQFEASRSVSVPSLRNGANSALRVDNEWLILLRKPNG